MSSKRVSFTPAGMPEPRFGDIVSLDYEPEMRAMLICRNFDRAYARRTRTGKLQEVWHAIVLHDREWPTGHLVSVKPDMTGYQLVDRAEDL